jgi:outer membrane protein assembly factor BamB
LIYITAIKYVSTTRFSGGIFMLLTAVITEAEEGGFIALNPETGTMKWTLNLGQVFKWDTV